MRKRKKKKKEKFEGKYLEEKNWKSWTVRREGLFGMRNTEERAIRWVLNNSVKLCLPAHNPDLGWKSRLKFQNFAAS